jgi:hypothetical protein
MRNHSFGASGSVGLRFQRRRRIGVLSVGEALFVRALYAAGDGAGRVNGKAILSVTASVGHDAAGFPAFPLHSSIASVLGAPSGPQMDSCFVLYAARNPWYFWVSD